MTNAGQPVPHESARGHVTGEALYTDDLAGRFPGLLHAWPVLAPHAHARLTALDVAPALEEPGVVDDADRRRCAGRRRHRRDRHDEPLFPREVMFHRQPVAWVLGDTLDAAQRGAARVAASSTSRCPRSSRSSRRLRPEAISPTPLRLARGDVSALDGQRAAPRRRAGHRRPGALLSRDAVAPSPGWTRAGGVARALLHAASRPRRRTSSRACSGLPRHQVTVECLRMGGAFGGKEVQANAWAAIAALGAWKTRRPVRVRLTRELDMALTGKRHPYLARYSAGFAADGRIEGAAARALLRRGLESRPVGADHVAVAVPLRQRLSICRRSTSAAACAARTRRRRPRSAGSAGRRRCWSSKRSSRRRRSGCRCRPTWSASATSIAKATPRTTGRSSRTRSASARSGSELKETSRFRRAPDGDRARSTRAHDARKRGLAITPVKFGISFTATFFNQAGALVLVYRDGTVQVNHGGTEMGQGLFTKIHQIAADALGVPTRPRPRDADAHRQGPEHVGDGGVRRDRSERRRRRRRVRADQGAADRRCRQPSGRRCACRSPERVRGGVPCSACRSSHRATTGRPTFTSTRRPAAASPFHYFAFGAAVSEVEVDGFTGAVSAAADRHPAGRRRLDLADDRSRSDRRRIHPGRGLADARGAALGRRGTARHAAAHPPTSCRRGRRCRTCST